MSVAVIKAEQWKSYIATLAGKVNNPNPILRAAFSTFGFKDVIGHFGEERGSNGPWKRRSVATQFAYAAINSGLRKPPSGYPRAAFNPTNKLLQLTGNLRKSLLVSNVREKGRGSIEFFANAIYSGTHDRGDSKKNIPQREFMWLSGTATERMANFIADELSK